MTMTKLLPPYIEGKLPAQVNGVLSIPYAHNRAVGPSNYKGFKIKLKTVATGQDIGFVEAEDSAGLAVGVVPQDMALVVGQYYKAQLAYVGADDDIGYFSSVGVFKYTATPTLYISAGDVRLKENAKNAHMTQYIGTFENNPADLNEKVYTYRFDVYSNGQIIDSSGDLLHNSSQDTEANQSHDSYLFNRALEKGTNYAIQYTVTTGNGLTISSPKYYISDVGSIPMSLGVQLKASNIFDDGCIQLSMSTEKTAEIKGHFRILRFSSLDNFVTQEEMARLTIDDIVTQELEYILYKDYTVQQGTIYKYAIQQYYENLHTDVLMSNTVYSDFEDAFLYDGERQLKIRFNTKIAQFKDTVLESKLDTIGGRYPFIFRNGRTRYKEFSIAGLISYLADENQEFYSRDDYISTNLTSENISMERRFKLEALEWLNNGKMKLFRSPTEGNYIVRLMNISLSPEETLGRMLHSFNSTAYEIANFSYDNLVKYNFAGKSREQIQVIKSHSLTLRSQMGKNLLLNTLPKEAQYLPKGGRGESIPENWSGNKTYYKKTLGGIPAFCLSASGKCTQLVHLAANSNYILSGFVQASLPIKARITAKNSEHLSYEFEIKPSEKSWRFFSSSFMIQAEDDYTVQFVAGENENEVLLHKIKLEQGIESTEWCEFDVFKYNITPALAARFSDMTPNTEIKLFFESGKEQIFRIGLVGGYEFNSAEDKLVGVQLLTPGATGRLEYKTAGSSSYPLTLDKQQIVGFSGAEMCCQYLGAESLELIPMMLLDAQASSLNNILYLKVENKPIFTSSIKPNREDFPHTNIYQYNNAYYTYDSAQDAFVVIDKLNYLYEINGNWAEFEPKPFINANSLIPNQEFTGRIIYTNKDFDGTFVPTSLTLGNGLYADVYYTVNRVELEEKLQDYELEEVAQ